MQNKIINTTARTLLNTLILGVAAAAAIFTAYTLKATGEKYIDGLTEDINSIRKGGETEKEAA